MGLLRIFTLVFVATIAASVQAERCSDYNELIRLSTLFYEAQRSGKLPGNQRVTWRKDSALNDRGQNGEDLTGGYYDAGDFVKFGFPMAGSITILSWGAVAFPQAYDRAGMTNFLYDQVGWGADYFVKAHISENELYGQVGDGYADHGYWGRPEDMTMDRPAFKITPSNPGSDLAGETSAAMAATSMVFRGVDDNYANNLLNHAKQLFNFADQHRGIYSDSIPQAADFYKSWSGFNDELVWSALWLHKATGEQHYLDYAISGYAQYGFANDMNVLSWDSKVGGIKVLLSEATGQYIDDVTRMCDHVLYEIQKSPQGETFIDKWGSLRHTSNAAFVCLMATNLNIPDDKKQAYLEHAKGQMDYILDKTGRSFVVGFGNNSPQKPHHRSSSCPDAPSPCDWSNFSNPGPNPQVLYGALVGGPDAPDDQYNDDRGDYVENEVTTDYNAGFQGLVAGLSAKQC